MRSVVFLTALTAVAGVLVSGCGGSTSGAAPESSAPPAVSTPSAISSPEKNLDGQAVTVDGPLTATATAFLVGPDSKAGSSSYTAALYLPKAGKRSTLIPTVNGSEELEDAQYVLLSNTQEPVVVALISVRIPASGVQPQREEQRLLRFDDSGKLVSQVAIGVIDGVLRTATDSAAAVAVGGVDSNANSGGVGIGFSLADGSEKWRASNEQDVHGIGGALGGSEDVLFSFVQVEVPGESYPADALRARDVDSGAVKWTKTLKELTGRASGRVEVGKLGKGLAFLGIDGYEGHLTMAFRNADGTPVSPKLDTMFYDAVANQVVGGADRRATDEWTVGMSVTNADNGAMVYSIPLEQANALELSLFGTANSKIWATTTDEHVVLDASTGKTLETGWTTYPAAAGPGWMLMAKGESYQKTYTISVQRS